MTLLILVGCSLVIAENAVTPEPTPAPTALPPTPTENAPPTPMFIVMADASVSRALLDHPELYLVKLDTILDSGGFANIENPGSLPNTSGYIYQYPGATAVRDGLIRNGKLDTSLWTEDATACSYDLADSVNAARAAARDYGIPMEIMGPLILSESSFTNILPGQNGGCYLINNGVAACLGQIYKPSGWRFAGNEIHPDVNVWDLFNPYTCMQNSARILDGRQYWTALTGARNNPESWFPLVAGYKNIGMSHEHFQNVFLKYYYAGGFAYTHTDGRNYWISFSSDLVNSELVFE